MNLKLFANQKKDAESILVHERELILTIALCGWLVVVVLFLFMSFVSGVRWGGVFLASS